MTHTGELRKGNAPAGVGRKSYNEFATKHIQKRGHSDEVKAARFNSGVIEGPFTSTPEDKNS